MSIAETQKIDLVATRPDSNVVKLVITDHLSWDDALTHQRLLQEKLNTYITFVESGQLQRMKEPRIPASPDVRIALAAQYAPDEEAKEFLQRAEDFLKNLGIGFEVKIHADG